jgi:AcrR family transcriptional regulator
MTTTTSEPAFRPRGREAVRAAVLESAMRLFADRGPSAVSLRDIATAANVNLGLLHRHFGSKAELVTAAIEHYAASARPRVLEALASKNFPASLIDVFRHEVAMYTRLSAWILLDGTGPTQATYPIVKAVIELFELRGVSAREARARSAAVFGMAAGYAFFEPTLHIAAELDDVPDSVIEATFAAMLQPLLEASVLENPV